MVFYNIFQFCYYILFFFFYLTSPFSLFLSYIDPHTHIIFTTRDNKVEMFNVYFTDRRMEEPNRKVEAIAMLKKRLILIKKIIKIKRLRERHEEKRRTVLERLKCRSNERFWVSLLSSSWTVTISNSVNIQK